MIEINQKYILTALFTCALIANVVVWLQVRDVKGYWANVPPVPGVRGASLFALGDQQLAYRVIGIMLQNLGDTGGRSAAFDEYDYETLTRWFFLNDELDPESSFTPFLASFYYGSVKDHSKLRSLLTYLREIGARPGGQRWRWLAHGVYLARFQMNDLDIALEFANLLADVEDKNMPAWTKQMPAFILNAKGNKEEALAIMIEILKTSADKIHPNEVNFTRDYICTRLLEAEDADSHPLCQHIH